MAAEDGYYCEFFGKKIYYKTHIMCQLILYVSEISIQEIYI